MTEEEAQKMLAELSKHYNEPVMPITKYCDGLRLWQKCLSERVSRQTEKCFPGTTSAKYPSDEYIAAWDKYREASTNKEKVFPFNPETGQPTPFSKEYYDQKELWKLEKYLDQVNYTFMQIQKSSFLGRILYGGETFRTEMCPEHEGKWSGLPSDTNDCEYGCDLTGWLPKK